MGLYGTMCQRRESLGVNMQGHKELVGHLLNETQKGQVLVVVPDRSEESRAEGHLH